MTPLLTVATDLFSLSQTTFLLVALEGVTVTTMVAVSPTFNVFTLSLRVNPVTPTTTAGTVTLHEAVFSPSTVFTVMTALPTDTAVTFPLPSTTATEGLEEDQVTALLAAFEGMTVQLRTVLLPTSSWTSVLSSPTLFTFTTSLLLSLLLFSLL